MYDCAYNYGVKVVFKEGSLPQPVNSMEKEKKSLEALVEKIEGKLVAIASTENEDRLGDVVLASGWDLRSFKKNPVLLFAHNYTQPPIGLAKNIKVEGKKLMFEPVFHGITELSRQVKQLYEEGIMKAFSVGFIAKELDEKNSNIITKSELLEISAVPVPANAEALVQMSKSIDKGAMEKIEKWVCKEVKDDNSITIVSPEELQDTVIKPYPNEHSCRLKPPAYDKYARKNCFRKHDGKCIDFIFGIKDGKSEVQAMRYDKKVWTASDAKSHCSSKGGTFESAKDMPEEKKEVSEINELKEKINTLD